MHKNYYKVGDKTNKKLEKIFVTHVTDNGMTSLTYWFLQISKKNKQAPNRKWECYD